MDLFQKAIALDPSYALSYAGLSYNLAMMTFYGFIPGKENLERVRTTALKALELDPSLAEPHLGLAFYAFEASHDLSEAIREAQKAIALKADLAIAYHTLSIVLNLARRSEEALMAVRKATEIDPLTPLFQAHVGWILHCLGRDEQGWQAVKTGLDLHPGDYYLIRILIYCANAPQQTHEAIEAAKTMAPTTKSIAMENGLLGFAYAKGGRREEAEGIVREFEQSAIKEPGLGYYIGLICSMLGQHEKAVQWLEKAEQAKLGLLMIVGVEPSFNNLRTLPRFQALLDRLGLPR